MFQIGWTYDPNGYIEGLIYPDGTPVTFVPNALGQPTQAAGFASNVKYYPNGAMDSFTYGNGVAHKLYQNSRQLPQRSKDGNVVDLSYSYDKNANVSGVTDLQQASGVGSMSRAMTYDGLDRLGTANAAGLWGNATFNYDYLDNLTNAVVGSRNCTYNYNTSLNRLNSLSGLTCALNYTWDSRGNVASRTAQGVTRVFGFDLANRLTGVSGVESYTYTYDGLGHRVRILNSVDGSKRYQLYSQSGQMLYARNTADGSETDYIYLNGSLIARNEAGPPGGDLPAPSNLTANPNPSTTGNYTVSWNAVPNTGSYRLTETVNGVTTYYYPGLSLSVPFTNRPHGSYTYMVQACESVCGAESTSVTEVVTGGLGAPASITANPNPSPNGAYTVSWDAVSGAIRYRLEERAGTSGGWSLAQTGPGRSKTYSGTSAKPPGTTWQYRARGCSDVAMTVCGSYTNPPLTVTVLGGGGGSVPPVPSTLSVTPTTSYDGNYTVSWSASATATYYVLEERKDGGTWHSLVSPTATSWSPNPPKSQSGVYGYHVKACNTNGCSAFTATVAEVTVNFLAAPTGIGVWPLLVRAGAQNAHYTVSWHQVSPTGTNELEEHSTPGCTGQRPLHIDHNIAGESKQYDAFLPTGCDRLIYHYRARTCEGTHCSPWTENYADVEVYTGPPSRPTSVTAATYLYTDALGSPIAEHAPGSAPTYRYYEPYGNQTNGPAPQGPGYTGHVMDEKTGLVYMQQRYYDPLAGRFLSVDPVAANPGSFNRYWYGNDNPYKFTDPDGRIAFVDDAAGFVVGGLIGVVAQTAVNLATGEGLTLGDVAGAFVGGGIVGVGAVNAPETGGISFAVAVGGLAGAVGNTVKQSIDIATGAQTSEFSGKDVAVSGAVGMVAGGATEGMLPNAKIPGLSSGRNNMNAIGKAARTRIANGHANTMSPKTAMKAAVGSQAAGIQKTAGGAAIEMTKNAVCHGGKDMCK